MNEQSDHDASVAHGDGAYCDLACKRYIREYSKHERLNIDFFLKEMLLWITALYK